DHEDVIDAFCTAWSDPSRRLWLAALIGDWPAAADRGCSISDSIVAERIAGRAAACRSMRCDALLRERGDAYRDGDILYALDYLDAGCLEAQLEQILNGPVDGAASVALKIIERRDDPAWCAAVYTLFRRLDPAADLPEPYLWAHCQRFLLRHGYHF